jgi:dihydroxyacetone kinase-like protein
MAGASVTVLKADDELAWLWDAPGQDSRPAMGTLTCDRCRVRRPAGGWLASFRDAVHEHGAYLTELDSAIGDADHGANLIRGMDAVMAAVDSSRDLGRAAQEGGHDAGDLGRRRERAALRHVLPARGAAAADALGARRAGPAGGAPRRARGIVARGKAEPATRRCTTPSPRPRRVRASAGPGADAAVPLARPPDAAAAGRDATEPMLALKGPGQLSRRDASVGTHRPGAASSALLVRGAGRLARTAA